MLLRKSVQMCYFSSTVAGGNRILPQSHKKSILEKMHRRKWAIVARLIEVKTRTAPQCSKSHPWPSGSALSYCRRSLDSGSPDLHCCPSGPGRPDPREGGLPSLSWAYVHVGPMARTGTMLGATLWPMWLPDSTCMAAMEKEHMTNTSPRLLFSLDDISWDLGRGKLSFKLTKLPNSSWACVGPSLIQSFSCIFWGSVPLSYPILFPDYPGYTPPLYVAILAPTVHASAQEFPLHWFSLPLVIYGIGPAASQED